MSADTRRARQHRIASLLDELEEQRRYLYRLEARGARPAALRDLKDDLTATQERLLDAVGA